MKGTALVIAATALSVGGAFAQTSVGIDPNAADRPTLQQNGPRAAIDFRRTGSIFRAAPMVRTEREVMINRYGDPSLYRASQ